MHVLSLLHQVLSGRAQPVLSRGPRDLQGFLAILFPTLESNLEIIIIHCLIVSNSFIIPEFQTVDPAQKKIYYEMSVIDRLRYLEEMKHYIPPPPPLLPPGVGKKAPSPTQPKKQVFATLTSIPTEGDAQFSIGSQSQHYSQETQNYSENSQQDSQQVQEVPQQGPEMSQNEQEEPPQDSQQDEDSSEEIDVGTEEDFSSLAIEKWW